MEVPLANKSVSTVVATKTGSGRAGWSRGEEPTCCVVCDLRKSGESGPAELGPLGLAERARALNYKPSQ